MNFFLGIVMIITLSLDFLEGLRNFPEKIRGYLLASRTPERPRRVS